ncbi:unnamed protein product [Soboliphyme baturini]|uniref:G_PROTEIN_RECEP_F1_2 domain-containing protein n=1 Tax=Soboliphyme baturini TaxID=241478 RepID=A0A183J7L6_9BILA|nr:unnamed protein product [Soboliphyme baturini]
MEFSVLFFGLLFGHLDSRTSIKRAIVATAVITVVYTILQVYLSIFILPFTPLRQRFLLPKKRRFYVYCAFLLLLDILLVTGSGLLLADALDGMCVIDAASYTYFAFYAPLMYAAFLRGYVSINQSALYFSYVVQKNFPGQISSVSNLNEFYGTAESLDQNAPSTADLWSTVDCSDLHSSGVSDTAHGPTRLPATGQLSIPPAVRV